MSQPGREDVAEISRNCRALVSRQSQLPAGSDPAQDPIIRGVLDEVTKLPVPHHSLQFMGAMVVAMHRRLVRVMGANGKSALTLDDTQRVMAKDGNTDPSLLQGCFNVVQAVARDPRNEDVLADAMATTGNTWGVYSNLTLSYLYLRLARTVVNEDASVDNLDQLLAEVSLAEEVSLIEQGDT